MSDKRRVNDTMRLLALASEVGKMKCPRISFQLQVWEEGFTVSIYRSGRCVASSEDPMDDIQAALRSALDALYGVEAPDGTA